MANNLYVNKVIYNGEVKIDLTGVTVTEDKVLKGYTAVTNSGEFIEGTAEHSIAVVIGNKLVIPQSMAVLSGKNLIFN